MADKGFDQLLCDAVHDASRDLVELALHIGESGIRERDHMQPALLEALVARLGADRVKSEQRLDFVHWQGVAGRRVGPVDLAVSDDDDRRRALIELKWCPPDGLYLGWAIWDFYKTATGRVSPGGDACYLIALLFDDVVTLP